MKKRVLAFVSALTLAFTAMSAVMSTASAETKPTIKVELLDGEGNKITNAAGLEVGDVFKVKYSYEGFDELKPYVAGRTKTGTVMTSIQFLANIPCDDVNLYWLDDMVLSDAMKNGTAQINNDYDNGRLVYVISFTNYETAPSSPSGELGYIEVEVKKPITDEWIFDFDTTYESKVYVNEIVSGNENPYAYTLTSDEHKLSFETATLKVAADEPEITINDKYVFNFTAEEGQDVMVTLKRTNGITSDLTYALPKDVKGTASIFGLLKVVDATVVSGDKFDIDVVDANRNVVKPITTITVD